jgi:hypothetical protein
MVVVNCMTSKQDPVAIDAHAMILHAARQGQSLERYMMRVMRDARKKIKRLNEGLVIDG